VTTRKLLETTTKKSNVRYSTAGCRDVTLPASGEVCAPVLALRQAETTAERCDVLEGDLHEVEKLNLVIANRGGDARGPAFDSLTDYLQFLYRPISFSGSERNIRACRARFSQNLGGIFPIKPTDAIRAVETSDILILSDERL
jgi:hypothetical protein